MICGFEVPTWDSQLESLIIGFHWKNFANCNFNKNCWMKESRFLEMSAMLRGLSLVRWNLHHAALRFYVTLRLNLT
jgi:hypothetical protein